MSNLSVALLNYNGKTHLENFLPSVVQFSTGHDIIVIDNGSTDGSVEFVKTNFPSVRLITYSKNYGFCGGYNKALKELDHEFVVLLNTDVQVSEGWISPILKLMESDSSLAAVQPKILDLKKQTHFEYAGASGGYLDILGYPFCRGRVFHTIEEDQNQYQETQDVFWASGASLFVRRSAYFEAGGLDEDFFAHMEEIDLCWRFWNLGYKVKVCPESVVYHLGGGTLDKSSPRKTYLNFRNGLTILLKNEITSDLFWKFPIRLILDWLAIAQFSILSGLPHGFAIIRAHFDFMRSIPSQIKKRKSAKRLSQNNPRYTGLVIWDYFLRQKKTYQKINS